MSAERRVRITLEGTAEPAGHLPHVLRVRMPNGSVTWIDTRAGTGVTVEDIPTGRPIKSRSHQWRAVGRTW